MPDSNQRPNVHVSNYYHYTSSLKSEVVGSKHIKIITSYVSKVYNVKTDFFF